MTEREPQIVLTADRGSFTDYGGSSVLGYVACMPSRLVPRLFMDKFFTPPVKVDPDGGAIIAPYALRKLEAALVNKGFQVSVIPPEVLEAHVKDETKILGITAHDPYGLDPVSFKLTFLFGGGETWTARFFRELGEKVSTIKRRRPNLKVIVGGPGAWELVRDRPVWVDHIFLGEGEVTFPEVARQIIEGGDLPTVIRGRDPKVEEIPPIINPARLGEVQITRGCPRGCQFCSITPETFRSIPLDVIKSEVEVNLKVGGMRRVEFITDDVLLYGSRKLRTNKEAVVRLFSEVMAMGVDGIWWPHISAPAVRESPGTVRAMAEIVGYNFDRAVAPVVGLETGSVRIFEKYMRAKAFPWSPMEWDDVIIDATAIMNDNYIYPCYTMTIGYPEETNEDVEDSIELVQKIVDHDFTAWVFPLPVIPISTTRIRENPFPYAERLPSRYWDLLYVSWHHNIKVTKKLSPILTNGIPNSIVRKIVRTMIEKVFDSIDQIFLELKESKGKKSLDFSAVSLNNTLGVLKSVYWLTKLSFKNS